MVRCLLPVRWLALSSTLGRALGIDLGSKRIGVALSDSDRVLATPYSTVKRVGDRPKEHALLAQIVQEEAVTVVVIGVPYGLANQPNPASKSILREIKALRKVLDVEVVEQDERLTTVEAEHSLRFQGVKGVKKKDVVDQLAAAIILQSWIDAKALHRG